VKRGIGGWEEGGTLGRKVDGLKCNLETSLSFTGVSTYQSSPAFVPLVCHNPNSLAHWKANGGNRSLLRAHPLVLEYISLIFH
jgi:hypothetical protein